MSKLDFQIDHLLEENIAVAKNSSLASGYPIPLEYLDDRVDLATLAEVQRIPESGHQ
jgi:hypothetical protein